MKAVVYHGIGDIRIDSVPEPKIKDPNDVIVRITTSAICGTDLHFVRGTVAGMKSGTILGHEAVGVVEEYGKAVRNLRKGDRVVVPSTIGCGSCNYCRSGYYSQCDNANPGGKLAGTAFFGGPANAGSFDGLQAEYARIPWGNAGLVKLPDSVSDEQAILISDIFPTGYQAAEIAEIRPGNTVAIFGCGPVGQFAIASAKLLRAGRIFAVDTIPSRLELARAQGAEVIDYNAEDPIEVIRELTEGSGADRVIDCVGVDANSPHSGPASKSVEKAQDRIEQKMVAPKTNEDGDNWHPGDAPSQVLRWMTQAVAKAGTLSIIGVYPETARSFPIGMAMNRNLTINMGNCNHRKYEPMLVDLVAAGVIDPSKIVSHSGPLVAALEAYEHFDKRDEGWVKVVLDPLKMPSKAA